MRRSIAAGAAAVALYAAVAGATARWSGHRVRPLFEGISSPVPYQWVKPPPQFAANNIKAAGGSGDIAFANGRSKVGVAASVDQQFIADLAAGAFAPHDGDTNVHAVVTPLDPAPLAALPTGLHPDGNVYRIQFTYEPSGAPVSVLAVAGDVIMSAPFTTATMLYSPDGTKWQEIPKPQQVGGTTSIGGTFDQPGYYLAASRAGAAVSPAGGASGGSSGTVVIAVGVGLGAVVLAAGAWWMSKRRRRPPRRTSGSSGRRPPPKARNTKGGRQRR